MKAVDEFQKSNPRGFGWGAASCHDSVLRNAALAPLGSAKGISLIKKSTNFHYAQP